MVEWVGGLVSMPGYVTGEGEPYRPEMILWMNDDGGVVGAEIAKPGEGLGMAAASLQSAFDRPMIGRPTTPGSVRVASPALVDVLRPAHPTIEIVCAPTPEIDELVSVLHEKISAGAETHLSYLGPQIDPDAIASFFRAAAELHRVAPWTIVPSDDALLAVTIESLDVRDAVMCVIGQAGESLGLVLFPDLAAFDAFVDAADALERGEAPALPPHLSLNFERGADLDTSLRKEIAEHGWVVAGADAYPVLTAMDEDMLARPHSARELTIGETLALVLCQLPEDREALQQAWRGGAPVEWTISVRTHAGEVEVSLAVPHPDTAAAYRPSLDVIADLMELDELGDEIDPEVHAELVDALVDAFGASPEAQALAEDVGACRLVMEFAADQFGASIATLGPTELREIVFETIPRQVSIDAGEAPAIIDECRALYAFLKREYDLPQADACQRVLAGDAAKRLELRLGDPRNFGMAKSLVMSGRAAGFDMSTKAGLEAWMREAQSRQRSEAGPAGTPISRPQDPAAARANKQKRKQARKARKKNR